MDKSQPSLWAVAIASAIISGLAGYFLGQASSIGVFQAAEKDRKSLETSVPDSEASSEDELDGKAAPSYELSPFSAQQGEECKLVLVVRTDLGMTKGKIAAQCSHATLACYKTLSQDQSGSAVLRRWERYGQAKVAVQVKNEADMDELQARAMSLGICAEVIHDAGRTQIAAGSATVLGVGPAPRSVVDQVTSHLKLL